MKSLSCTHIFCRLFVYPKISQPACDALRLWEIPRHPNPRREEWQLGNVSSRNYFALRLFADIVHLVSNTVLHDRFPSHAQHPLSDRFKVCYVVSRHDPTLAQLLSFPVSLGSVWRPSRALRFRPRVASRDEDDDSKDNDMDRPEREVSSYPGFKSTPRLETLFTSRRLQLPISRAAREPFERSTGGGAAIPREGPRCVAPGPGTCFHLIALYYSCVFMTQLRSSTRFRRACRTFPCPGRLSHHRTLPPPLR